MYENASTNGPLIINKTTYSADHEYIVYLYVCKFEYIVNSESR